MGHVKKSTRNQPSWRQEGYKAIESWKATCTRCHSWWLAPTEWEMKKSLSGLEIINGARDVIESVDCSGTSGNTGDSGGGPVYITSGQNGVSPSKYLCRSSSLDQGNSSTLSLSSESVGHWKSVWLPMLRNFAGTLNGCGGRKPEIPASLNGWGSMALWSWLYWVSGLLISSKGIYSAR